MAGIVPVFMILDEANIYAFLALAFDLVHLVVWRGVWTPSKHKSFKLGLEFEVHLDQLFARRRWGQSSKNLLVFLNELSETGAQGSCSPVSQKSPPQHGGCSSPFRVSSYNPIVSGGSSSSQCW